MKELAITVLAVIGGFAVFKYFKHERNRPSGQGSHNNGPWISNIVQSQVSDVSSGVPTFVTIPVEAGHGDQYAATCHSNDMSTIDGGANYQPAFGPNENRGGTDDMHVW